MNEYKVKIKITSIGFFTDKDFRGIEIIKADSYLDARKQAQKIIDDTSFELEDNDCIAIIEDIEKL